RGEAVANIVCPYCQKVLLLEEHHWGTFIGCSGCGNRLKVPASSQSSSSTRPAEQESLPAPCPRCGKDLPAGALLGFCPACLLEMAEEDRMQQPEQPAVPAPPAEIPAPVEVIVEQSLLSSLVDAPPPASPPQEQEQTE